MDNKDELKICDNWEDDWENCDEIEAKLKANIEETKKKEIQQLVDKAEEELIEDLFLHNTGVNPRKPPLLCCAMRHDLVQHGGKAPVKVTSIQEFEEIAGKLNSLTLDLDKIIQLTRIIDLLYDKTDDLFLNLVNQIINKLFNHPDSLDSVEQKIMEP